MIDNIPRRAQTELWCDAEKAISAAMHEVEKMPPDVRLTCAVDKLSEAKSLVADYIDGFDQQTKTP